MLLCMCDRDEGVARGWRGEGSGENKSQSCYRITNTGSGQSSRSLQRPEMDIEAPTTTSRPSLEGRGRGKMMWGGGGGGETAVRSMVKLSREAPETSSIVSVLGEMHLVPTNPAERKTMEDITTLLRNPDVKTSDVDKVLHSHLGV